MLLKPTDKHIIVNYHYVEDPRADFSGIHPCSIQKFEKQIAWLSDNFAITTIQNVFKAAQEKVSEKYCALTFDDGLKGQYKNAVPVLKKYDATAIFFPITMTLEGRLPGTHKIHILLSRFSTDELIDFANTFLNEYHPQLVKKYYIPKDRRITTKRKLRDDIKTANFKETMNILPNVVEEQCLKRLFEKIRLNEKKIVQKLFMSKEEIQTLEKEGFSVGCHLHNHYALDSQEPSLIKNEIRLSKERLANIVRKSSPVISYPHGGVNKTVIKIAKEEGFIYGFTIERREVHHNDNPLTLPRYDTNDIVIDSAQILNQ